MFIKQRTVVQQVTLNSLDCGMFTDFATQEGVEGHSLTGSSTVGAV